MDDDDGIVANEEEVIYDTVKQTPNILAFVYHSSNNLFFVLKLCKIS
jgi:hypothetical protein